MVKSAKSHIFFVDDEPKIREVVGETLKERGFKVSCFANGIDCMRRLISQRCDLLITDVKMPEMDGMELLKQVKSICPWLPVLLITGYGDIPMAVRAVQAGAANFIEKPLQRDSLLLAIRSVLQQGILRDPLLGKSLTKAQMRVLRLLLAGNTNKETAKLLHRDIRTIEWHRVRIMRKLGAKTPFELGKRATTMGLAGRWQMNDS